MSGDLLSLLGLIPLGAIFVSVLVVFDRVIERQFAHLDGDFVPQVHAISASESHASDGVYPHDAATVMASGVLRRARRVA